MAHQGEELKLHQLDNDQEPGTQVRHDGNAGDEEEERNGAQRSRMPAGFQGDGVAYNVGFPMLLRNYELRLLRSVFDAWEVWNYELHLLGSVFDAWDEAVPPFHIVEAWMLEKCKCERPMKMTRVPGERIHRCFECLRPFADQRV